MIMFKTLGSKVISSWNKLKAEALSEQGWKFLIILGICAAFFAFYKKYSLHAALEANESSLLVALIFAVAGIRVSMSDLELPSRIILRTISGLFTLYIFFTHSTFDLVYLSPTEAWLLEPGRYLFTAIALASIFFPSLNMISVAYVIWFKKIGASVLLLTLTPTDYMPLIEMSSFLSISGIIWHYLKKYDFWARAEETDEKALTVSQKILMISIASHMINYYHSATAKAVIGDHWYSWILENQTHSLLLTAQAAGQLPLGFNDGLLSLVYLAFDFFIVPMNFVLFFGQLFAIIALLRVRWGIWAMLFYDLTHLVIFFASGIFFYKWITLNLSIVFALKTFVHKTVSPIVGLLTIFVVLFGPMLFFTARLGWWDTPAVNLEYLSAITKDGKEVRAPSNYWGNMSVTAAQQRLIWGKNAGFLPTSTYGISFHQRIMEKSIVCDIDIDRTEGANSVKKYFDNADNALSIFVNRYHEWALQRAGEKGTFLYDAYPHHIFSMPWMYPDFMDLNLNDVVAYRYNLKAICLKMDNGHIKTKVLREEHHDIPVK